LNHGAEPLAVENWRYWEKSVEVRPKIIYCRLSKDMKDSKIVDKDGDDRAAQAPPAAVYLKRQEFESDDEESDGEPEDLTDRTSAHFLGVLKDEEKEKVFVWKDQTHPWWSPPEENPKEKEDQEDSAKGDQNEPKVRKPMQIAVHYSDLYGGGASRRYLETARIIAQHLVDTKQVAVNNKHTLEEPLSVEHVGGDE